VPGCRSSRNVDLDHIIEWAKGGTHTIDNLVTTCESHHIARHNGTLSIRFENGAFVFERQGRNNFTRVERAVDTGLALKGLGYKKEEIKAALDRTRTQVGTADLSLQQWITIALSYCPSALTEPRRLKGASEP
jgi:hypothetical protein